MGFLLDFLGFLSLITTSLLVITLQAYWPLSQSIEFTNSSPRLPGLIYFFFTFFFILMYLLLHSLGSLGLFTSYLPLFYLVGLLAINPTISTYWACFLIPLPFSFPHLLYCWASFVVGPFAINEHQHQPIHGR